MNRPAALLLCLLCYACAGPMKAPPLRVEGGPCSSIYVVNHGKHAGLILRPADIPRGLLPESADFPGADYLELGWGDWDYYQADAPGLWLTLKAALWPTASVVNVVGIKGSVAGRYAGYEIIRLELEPSAFAGLVAYIHRGFVRRGAEKAAPVGPRHYGDSLFYPARGRFHIFNTCNTWVARALEAAGYPMGIFRPITADQLMAKVRRFAGKPAGGSEIRPQFVLPLASAS